MLRPVTKIVHISISKFAYVLRASVNVDIIFTFAIIGSASSVVTFELFDVKSC